MKKLNQRSVTTVERVIEECVSHLFEGDNRAYSTSLIRLHAEVANGSGQEPAHSLYFWFQGDANRAISGLSAYLEKAEEPPVGVQLLLVHILIKADRFKQAIALAGHILSSNEKNTNAAFAKGWALHRANDFDKAWRCYKQALEIAGRGNYPHAAANCHAAAQRFCPVEPRFLVGKALAYDYGPTDRDIIHTITEYVDTSATRIAIYGAGHFFRYLSELEPAWVEKVVQLLDDEPELIGQKIQNRIVEPIDALDDRVNKVFIAATRFVDLNDMQFKIKGLQREITVVTLEILEHIAPQLIRHDAWQTIGTIYPLQIPIPTYKPDQDIIVLDLPARMQAQMPNGIAYLYNILNSLNIKSQIVDLDINWYHRFHGTRIFDHDGVTYTNSGYKMKEDPWSPGLFLDEFTNPEVIDFFEPQLREAIEGIIKARPRILGFSLHGTNIELAKRVVKGVRERYPEVIVIAGGYDCIFPASAREKFPEADYHCIREVDLTLGPLLESLLAGEEVRDRPGIVSRYDSPHHKFIPTPILHTLDDVPNLTYGWENDVSFYRDHNGYWLAPILSSRGCIWSRCAFCSERFKYRARRPEAVVDEIEWCMEKDAFLFQFNDSDLIGDTRNIRAICGEILRRGIKPQMIGQARIHQKTDVNFFRELKSAGFSHLRFGVDAFSKHTLRLEKKGYTVETAKRVLRDCHTAGIITTVNIVIGLPGETEQDIDETIENIASCKDVINMVENINPLVLNRGTDFYEHRDKYHIKFKKDNAEIEKYTSTIPPHLWYSENPHIDQNTRLSRLTRIQEALFDLGVNIGPYAAAMIKRHRQRAIIQGDSC